MGSESSSAPPSAHRTGWTSAKIIGLIVIIIVLASSGGAGFGYYVLRPAATLPKGQCSNSATNYPSCNICSSGSTFTGGACYTNCSNGTTNPPSCTQYPPCSSGAINPPACNKYPPCSNGGANPPTCTPPCSNGAANPPSCIEYPTRTSVDCDPSLVEANITTATCNIYVYSTVGPPYPTVNLDCQPHNTSGMPECVLTPSSMCPLTMTMSENVTFCSFNVEATGPSLTVYANYTGEQLIGPGQLLSSTGSFTFSVIPSPSSVVVSGTAKSSTIGNRVTGIVFKSTAGTYRASFLAGNYTVTLVNFETYTVTIIYETINGALGSCNAGTLNLVNPTGTLYIFAPYHC